MEEVDVSIHTSLRDVTEAGKHVQDKKECFNPHIPTGCDPEKCGQHVHNSHVSIHTSLRDVTGPEGVNATLQLAVSIHTSLRDVTP